MSSRRIYCLLVETKRHMKASGKHYKLHAVPVSKVSSDIIAGKDAHFTCYPTFTSTCSTHDADPYYNAV